MVTHTIAGFGHESWRGDDCGRWCSVAPHARERCTPPQVRVRRSLHARVRRNPTRAEEMYPLQVPARCSLVTCRSLRVPLTRLYRPPTLEAPSGVHTREKPSNTLSNPRTLPKYLGQSDRIRSGDASCNSGSKSSDFVKPPRASTALTFPRSL